MRSTPNCFALNSGEGQQHITKLCRRQAEVILNHENPNVRAIGQGEARHREHKRLKLAAVKSTTEQVSDCRF
jgi:acyl transferase domain-containing protein